MPLKQGTETRLKLSELCPFSFYKKDAPKAGDGNNIYTLIAFIFFK